MAHMIEKEDTVLATEEFGGIFRKMWHGLETVKERITLAVMKECGLLPNIKECPIVPAISVLNTSDIQAALKDWKLVYADVQNGKAPGLYPLSVPRESYVIHPYEFMVDLFVKGGELAFGKNNFSLVSAGTLGCYRNLFASAVIKDKAEFTIGNCPDGTPDRHIQYLGFTTSADCSLSSQWDYASARRQCANLIRMIQAETEKTGTREVMKHSKESLKDLTPDKLAKNFSGWVNQGDAYQAQLRALKDTSMDKDTFRWFLAGMFSAENSKELSTNAFNRTNATLPFFDRGTGNAGKTRYCGFNAVTEVMTHFALSDKVERSKRIAYASQGKGNDYKREALRLLCSEEDFTQAVKRGKALFEDKLLVMSQAN